MDQLNLMHLMFVFPHLQERKWAHSRPESSLWCRGCCKDRYVWGCVWRNHHCRVRFSHQWAQFGETPLLRLFVLTQIDFVGCVAFCWGHDCICCWRCWLCNEQRAAEGPELCHLWRLCRLCRLTLWSHSWSVCCWSWPVCVKRWSAAGSLLCRKLRW